MTYSASENSRAIIAPAMTALMLWLACIGCSLGSEAPSAARQGVKRLAWFPWDPYQYHDERHHRTGPTGLDIELARAVMARMNERLVFQQLTWEEGLRGLREGTTDITTGAFFTNERSDYAWYSDAYRSETVVLLFRRGEASRFSANMPDALYSRLAGEGTKVGIVKDYYYGPKADAFVSDPRNADRIEVSEEDQDNLLKLAEGTIDCFLADRLAAYSMAWRRGMLERIEHHPVILFESGVHMLLSKKTCSPEFVERFNSTLREEKTGGEYNRMARSSLVLVLLGITVHSGWFFTLDIIGTVAFALSGVILARKENYDIFGAFVLASLPAMGGGVVRDLLSERYPIGILRSPGTYIIAVIGTVLLGALCFKAFDLFESRRPAARVVARSRWGKLPQMIVIVCDAMGLAAFTVTGVVIAIEQRCEPLWLWGPLLAALTGAGGGILRDIVRADSNNPSLKGTVYPEIALVWGFLLTLYLNWETTRLDLDEVMLGVCLTIVGALTTRLLVVKYGIRSWMLGRPGTAPS